MTRSTTTTKKPAARKTPALRIEGLTKSYASLDALASLDLEVQRGESVALVGHNGSGKSTLLRIVAGLLEPTSGAAKVIGHRAGSLPARAVISFAPDEPVLYDDLSVREHVEYLSRLHGGAGCDEAAEGQIVQLGLANRADDLPTRFSRGLRQRTSMLVALCRPFEVLLVDEPFVGLDAAGKNSVLELFRAATDRGATVVVATHEESYVTRVSRCVALRDGELVHDGPATPADVLRLVS
jgi:ABC-type multidrug transport system ATPase subunit